MASNEQGGTDWPSHCFFFGIAIRGLGVDRSWRLPRLLKELEIRIRDEWRADQVRDLQDFIARPGTRARDIGALSLSLLGLGLDNLRRAAHTSLSAGRPEYPALALATAYCLRGLELEMHRLDLYYEKPDDAWGGFGNGAMLLAQMFSLGWTRIARATGDWFVASVLRGHYFDAGPLYRNCGAWYVTRLFADWRESTNIRWPDSGYPAPIYDYLLEHWRHPDETQLTEPLLAACDRHTHECWKWSDSPDKHGDFATDPYFGWPIEIHMLFRLRESLGLRNPALDHPLMQTGLGAYGAPSAVVTDELLDAVTARAAELLPPLAERLVALQGPAS